MPNPFIHVELNSTDVRKSKAFYTKLFKWKLKDMKMPFGTYTTIDVGRKGVGGGMMQQLMPKTPSFWLAYILVDDIEATTRKAEKLGAKVCKDVTEVAGMGWLSIVTDPAGATIGFWEPRKRR